MIVILHLSQLAHYVNLSQDTLGTVGGSEEVFDGLYDYLLFGSALCGREDHALTTLTNLLVNLVLFMQSLLIKVTE